MPDGLVLRLRFLTCDTELGCAMPRLVDVIEIQNSLGEGPLWNSEDGRLWWTDIHARRLHRLDIRTRRIDSLAMPERVGSFAFLHGETSRILVAFETGLAYFDIVSGAVAWIVRPEAGVTGRRFNDGRMDRHGRLWVASMVEDEAHAGRGSAALYQLDLDGGFSVQETGVGIGNGLCLSPDGGTLYFADSPRRTIHAYDLDGATGRLSNRRRFAQVAHGHPDGAAIDAGGDMWSARWGAGSVVRHAPDGSVAETLNLPVSQPTCVAFGGDDMRLMFVTSAREKLSPQHLLEEPLAGSVLIYEADVAGLPDRRYAAPAWPDV